MEFIDYVIITVVLIALALAIYYYINYYITSNLLNTATYLESLIYNAVVHEFQNAASLASLGNVKGSFTYQLTLPSATMPNQGTSLYYEVTLYPGNLPGGGVGLFLNLTVIVRSGQLFVELTKGNLPVYSSSEPFTVVALNCINQASPVVLVSGSWSTAPTPKPSCTWSSVTVTMGKAVIIVEKNATLVG